MVKLAHTKRYQVIIILVLCQWHGERPTLAQSGRETVAPYFLKDLNGKVFPSEDGRIAAISGLGMRPYMLDIATGKPTTSLEMPQGCMGWGEAFSADKMKIAGICRSRNNQDSLLVWNVLDGDILHQVVLPEKTVYVTSLRFVPNDHAVLVGGRTQLYEYSLETKTLRTIVEDVPYYVLDIASNSVNRMIGYIDAQSSFGFHQRDLVGGSLRMPRGDLQRAIEGRSRSGSLASLDYAADCTELAICALVPMAEGGMSSELLRFDVATGDLKSRVFDRNEIRKIRYVGDTKTLCVWGRPQSTIPGPLGGFGFLSPGSTALDGWHQVVFSITACSVNPNKNGHITVGLDNGTLLRWRREDWQQAWVAAFAE